MLRSFLLLPAERSAVILTLLMTDCASSSALHLRMHAPHSLPETDCNTSEEGFNASFVLE